MGPKAGFCLYLCKRAFHRKLVQRTSLITHDGSLLLTAGFQFMECEEDLKHESHSARHFGSFSMLGDGNWS